MLERGGGLKPEQGAGLLAPSPLTLPRPPPRTRHICNTVPSIHVSGDSCPIPSRHHVLTISTQPADKEKQFRKKNSPLSPYRPTGADLGPRDRCNGCMFIRTNELDL